MLNRTFKISFAELLMLAEACIPPSPVGRADFFRSLIDKYYHLLDADERGMMFKAITAHPRFRHSQEDCGFFAARYNPLNQYEVICEDYEGRETFTAFAYAGKFWTSSRIFIDPALIISSKRID